MTNEYTVIENELFGGWGVAHYLDDGDWEVVEEFEDYQSAKAYAKRLNTHWS